MGILGTLSFHFTNAAIMGWDVLLTLGNLVQSSRPVGKVTPEGHPGYGGYWPEYRPQQENDSRCACPALNAMANHGILPRNGRGIKFTELTRQIRTTYNFGASFCLWVPRIAANMLKRDYNKDTFDLEELDLHNGIEHDGSLTRLDTALQPNQAIKHVAFIEELLSFATSKDADGKALLTERDMSRISGKRRAEAKVTNKHYTMSLYHKFFGSANSSTMLTIFGGRVDDLRAILLDERIPEGWEPRVRKPNGLTMITFQFTVLPVEFRTREADWAGDAKRLADSEAGRR
ncbi:Chloroperoxidase [Boletus edulis BED1]|uniref:Chloroperoxidase n=1 Tax=Boletus edulis BED1 TaxID=1328754 RepID=A0AAD4GM81_BOLED|nr:Chloroperoxidase [Boletus edulis BED1]